MDMFSRFCLDTIFIVTTIVSYGENLPVIIEHNKTTVSKRTLSITLSKNGTENRQNAGLMPSLPNDYLSSHSLTNKHPEGEDLNGLKEKSLKDDYVVKSDEQCKDNEDAMHCFARGLLKVIKIGGILILTALFIFFFGITINKCSTPTKGKRYRTLHEGSQRLNIICHPPSKHGPSKFGPTILAWNIRDGLQTYDPQNKHGTSGMEHDKAFMDLHG